MYNEEELREIWDVITGERRLSDGEIKILRNKFGKNKEIPEHMLPFIRLLATNPDLYIKIFNDEKVKKYSLFAFFPETFKLVYGSEIPPEIKLVWGGNRDFVAIIKHPENKFVIKPIQNSREKEIAKIADELGVGPKQYQSLEGFLTEEFVEGDLFSRLRVDRTSTENMYNIGRRMGEILKKLHSREIYYNDTILSDDLGKSHLIVPEEGSAILFDYGVALRLDKYPNLTDEEVYNFVRTLPIINMFLGMQQSQEQEQVKALVEEYRKILENTSKEEILDRDIDFIIEGLEFASYRLGTHIVEPFLRGFKETYER